MKIIGITYYIYYYYFYFKLYMYESQSCQTPPKTTKTISEKIYFAYSTTLNGLRKYSKTKEITAT